MDAFDFKEQLAAGGGGELFVSQLYIGTLTRLMGRGADFRIEQVCCGGRPRELLELKTELYADSQNLFVEHYSDDVAGKLGGPWQALANGATRYAFLLPHHARGRLILSFSTEKLIDLTEKHPELPEIRVRNKGWFTECRRESPTASALG